MNHGTFCTCSTCNPYRITTGPGAGGGASSSTTLTIPVIGGTALYGYFGVYGYAQVIPPFYVSDRERIACFNVFKVHPILLIDDLKKAIVDYRVDLVEKFSKHFPAQYVDFTGIF